MKKAVLLFTTSDKIELNVNRWLPDAEQEIKGVILFHHGLAEHSLRYDRFGSICAENGYVLNVYDMRGHGKTGEISEKNKTGIYGKIADKDGFNVAVRYFEELKLSIEKEFEGKKIFLMGHSFGSFIMQSYLQSENPARFSNVAGTVLIGSTGPNSLITKPGYLISSFVKKIKGNNYISEFVSKLIFGNYNNRIENPKSKFAWLCSNDFTVQSKEPAHQYKRCKRHSFAPWVRKIPWRRARQPTPVFLPRESHGQMSLVGHGPQGHKELDTTEVTQHTRIQEENKEEKNGINIWGIT